MRSYQWRAQILVEGQLEFVELAMGKTLAQNGVKDESIEFEALGLPTDSYIPVVHLYYKDDLTVA